MDDLIRRQDAIDCVSSARPMVIRSRIASLPKVATVPVRHAKWIAGKADGHVRCSECNEDYDWTSEAQYYNYCPICGAKMDG